MFVKEVRLFDLSETFFKLYKYPIPDGSTVSPFFERSKTLIFGFVKAK
jgi:hypothetical protein